MPRLNRDIDLAIKAAMGAVGGGMMFAPDEAEAMYVGPKSKGWGNLPNKFSSLMDRMERAEISDAGAKLRMDKFDVSPLPEGVTRYGYDGTLGEVLQHPELFKNYPELQSTPTRMVFDTGRGGGGGTGYYDGYQLQAHGIGRKPDQSTLLHEIQHAIQEKEGWARGGSEKSSEAIRYAQQILDKKLAPIRQEMNQIYGKIKSESKALNVDEDVIWAKYPDLDKRWRSLEGRVSAIGEIPTSGETFEGYKRLAGEIEARDTASRMGFSPEERQRIPPYALGADKRFNLRTGETYGKGIPLRDVITKMGVAAPVGAVLAEQLARKREMERKYEGGGLKETLNPAEYLIPARWGGGAINMAVDALLNQILGE